MSPHYRVKLLHNAVECRPTKFATILHIYCNFIIINFRQKFSPIGLRDDWY